MLFDTGTGHFESYKERNLYYKIFAGYLFNELVGDEAAQCKRISSFIELLRKKQMHKLLEDGWLECDMKSLHVSFDNHITQIKGCGSHQGEFADILIQDVRNKWIVSIEAKFETDWKHEKDIKSNADRLSILSSGGIRVVQCLLITGSKLEEAKKLASHQGSNWKKLQTEISEMTTSFVLITWEDVLGIVDDKKVAEFLERQLKTLRCTPTYSVESGSFVGK